MPSPFPGMNPYLEQSGLWRGFHNTLLVYFRAALTPLVVPRYFVELEESLYIDPEPDDYHLFAVADAMVGSATKESAAPAGSAAAVVAAPVTVTIPGAARKKARRLVLRDTHSREVVTVIEMLSPTNKQPGADREKYLEKRLQVVDSAANFVEIDLLRGGTRAPVRTLPACDYYVLVSRRAERPNVGLWPLRLRDLLPSVPIPLRPGEPEPLIPLKPVLDRAYDEAGYAYRVYQEAPEPRLSPEDAAWAKELLAAAGVTPAG